MASSASPSNLPGPLNPGDVVSAALRLYRDRFKVYFFLAAQATLWLGLGVVGAVAIMAIALVIFPDPLDNDLSLIAVLISSVVALVPLLYGLVQYFMLSAALGRLAFHELINQPETTNGVQQILRPKLGEFFLLLVQLLVIYIVIYLGAVLLSTLAGGLVGLFFGGIVGGLTNASIGGVLGVSLGILAGFLVFMVILIRVASLLFIAEVVLAIEPKQVAGNSIRRSMELSKTSVGRIQIIILATFLIQLPITILTNTLPSLLISALPSSVLLPSIQQVLNAILSLGASLFILPIWQSVKGVLYYDLRSRMEGLDLQDR